MQQTSELISRCLRLEPAAQKQLYLAHKDAVMYVCYRYASDMDEAKDMVQNTFIRVFNHLGDYDPDKGRFSTWIGRIAIREAIAVKRKNKKLVFTESLETVLEQPFEAESELETNIENLRKTIENLPENHRIILMLYYFDELSHQEIADLLQIEVSSSRSKLTRAKAELAQRWKLAYLSLL